MLRHTAPFPNGLQNHTETLAIPAFGGDELPSQCIDSFLLLSQVFKGLEQLICFNVYGYVGHDLSILEFYFAVSWFGVEISKFSNISRLLPDLIIFTFALHASGLIFYWQWFVTQRQRQLRNDCKDLPAWNL